MFTNRSLAVVAMVFGAFILAQPDAAMAADPGKVGFNPQPDPPKITEQQPATVPAAIAIPNLLDARKSGNESSAKPAEFNPAPEPDVDKAMGVMPSPGASKGIAFPGQNVGMEKSDEPEDEKSASKGIGVGELKPGGDAAAKGIIITGTKPGGVAASKGIAVPGANKGFNPVPEPAAVMKGLHGAPSSKALKGLKGAPAMQKY